MKKCKTLSQTRSYLSFAFVVDVLLIYLREEIDEETQEWERAQIRRSGLKADEDSSVRAKTPYKPTPSTLLHNF